MNGIGKRTTEGFTRAGLAFLLILSTAVSIRQVAMTMVMPFISVYSKSLSGYTPTLAGMALGIFGLAQAVFQIPFGLWSDKIGNKKVILIGFSQVIVGLVLAYYATSIYWLIAARALQGSGAVIAVVFSWISAGLDERLRLKAMSIASASIGFAAAASFAFGPMVHRILTVNEMFLACALIIAVSWLLILFFLKEPERESMGTATGQHAGDKVPLGLKPLVKGLLKNTAYLKLNAAAFINNYVMVAVFYIVPMYLQTITGTDGMWKVFMPAVAIAIIALKFFGRIAAKGYRYILLQAAFLLCAVGIALFYKPSYGFILAGSVLFMVCYICVSTIAQSCVNDMADAGYRGTTNGIFNSIQYLGSFIGSLVTGAAWEIGPHLALAITLAVAVLGIAVMRGTYGAKSNKFKDLTGAGKTESQGGR
ncbi:MFS transporter [Paenibacillus macerans]|uniref:MFS transporter n=1 Tax=Paenibacillus macerans TaxID=44252 RepID=UPI00203C5828|nr:MFS transporter [Paenibacillus macerans]MCM3702587.1 MFS transporter [Paenibacillus macerans]